MRTIYSPTEISEQLGIQLSTIRKYASALEKAGYTFAKNERGHRAYYDTDVITFRKLIDLKNGTDMSLEETVKAVVTWNKGDAMLVSDTKNNDISIATSSDIQLLHEKIDKQQELIERQGNILEELTRSLARREEWERKRDTDIMSAIRAIQDTKKEIAMTQSKKKWQFWK